MNETLFFVLGSTVGENILPDVINEIYGIIKLTKITLLIICKSPSSVSSNTFPRGGTVGIHRGPDHSHATK